MNRTVTYRIQHAGLAIGKHDFRFDLESGFFSSLDERFSCATLVSDMVMEKQDRLLILNFHIHGTLELVCDRCGGDVTHTVDSHYELFVKYGNSFVEESEDVIIVPEDSGELDIDQYLYDFASLSIPTFCVHPDDENGESTCDPAVVSLISNIGTEEFTNIENN
ncbi:MAG: DUF177 domain-containing protein [Bacteroidetes bacterium]|nr:DUF177 domain-containing protein [Bacteroidota bacterium]